MKKVLRVVVIVVVGVAAVVFARSRLAAADEEGVLRFYGNVDIREVHLGFRVGGRVVEVLKEEGDPVRAGEMMARLDDAPYRIEVDQAEAQVASAQARLEQLQAGFRTEEIAQARAEVEAREVALDNARRTLKRRETLAASKAIPEENYTDAEAKSHEAEAHLAAARAQLGLVEAGYRVEEVAQARAQVSAAEAALAAARLRRDDTVLAAPEDGVVITRAVEPGAMVQPGQTALTESLSTPVWVRAYVDEPDLGRIHPGMKMNVFTDSRPDQPYHGQVGYISPRAEFTPKSVETADLRTSLVYRMRIVVDDPDEGLRQGMPVTAEIAGEIAGDAGRRSAPDGG